MLTGSGCRGSTDCVRAVQRGKKFSENVNVMTRGTVAKNPFPRGSIIKF